LHRVRRGKTRRVNLHPRFGEYYIAYMIWREKIVILAVTHANHETDPEELHDVSAQHADVVAELTARISKLPPVSSH
jgi:hypothetical protein